MSTYFVNVNGVSVKTTVTDRASFVDNYITELILSCDYSNGRRPVVGFDVEWKEPTDSSNKKVATLQLCSASRCLIIQLLKMDDVPQSLKNFLSAPLFVFVGVDVCDRLAKLRMDYGLECRNVIELQPLIDVGVLTGNIETVAKPLSVILSDWGATSLTCQQIESATSDAHFFFAIGSKLLG